MVFRVIADELSDELKNILKKVKKCLKNRLFQKPILAPKNTIRPANSALKPLFENLIIFVQGRLLDQLIISIEQDSNPSINNYSH